MASVVYCIAKNDAHAIRIASRLRTAGCMANDISILEPDRSGVRDLAIDNSTKTPEGAVAGTSAGAILGGTLGWLAGIGTLAIPGLGPFIAAGPILAALSGAAVGGAVGGLSGALIGMGIPEFEAQQYEGKLRQGNILMAIHVADDNRAGDIRQILTEENAEDIVTGSEASVPSGGNTTTGNTGGAWRHPS